MFPGIKWPNDLMIVAGERFVGRKLAGILAESVVADGRIDAVVLGMGLNVNWPEVLPPSWPTRPSPSTTWSVTRSTGRPSWSRGCATSTAGST